MKAAVTEGALFIGPNEARVAAEEVLSGLVGVRAGIRHACKSESRAGREAHEKLASAEKALERALKILGATVKTTGDERS